MQAALSSLLSCALAIPVARALFRRRFPGRGAVIALTGAPFILPVIVAVLGIIAVYGRAGPISEGLQALGTGPLSIYGLPGILLAHVFFNLPLVVRLLLQGWDEVPAERLRLAASLGLGKDMTITESATAFVGVNQQGHAFFRSCLSGDQRFFDIGNCEPLRIDVALGAINHRRGAIDFPAQFEDHATGTVAFKETELVEVAADTLVFTAALANAKAIGWAAVLG